MNIYDLRDKCRQNFNKYLRQIISLISDMKGKQFLDIGCGTGVSACFIAQTFDYFITALDINESSLKVLRKKIKYLGLEDKIKVLKGSFEMLGKNEVMFDTILAEGLFNVIGFETGIKKTSKILKYGGFLILHDGQDEILEKKQLFKENGFSIIDTFSLDENIWWNEYCGCLEKYIKLIREKDLQNKSEKAVLKQIKNEVRLYHENPETFRSIYYLLKFSGYSSK